MDMLVMGCMWAGGDVGRAIGFVAIGAAACGAAQPRIGRDGAASMLRRRDCATVQHLGSQWLCIVTASGGDGST